MFNSCLDNLAFFNRFFKTVLFIISSSNGLSKLANFKVLSSVIVVGLYRL